MAKVIRASRARRALAPLASASLAMAPLAWASGADPAAKGAPSPGSDAALRDEIAVMVAADQAVRQKPSTALTKEDFDAMRRVDAAHEVRMRQIIARVGWPGRSLVGDDGAHAAWLVVQHLSREFEEECLPLLERAVARGEASATDCAYLLDRVRMYEGKPQVYGTQFQGNELYPIEDEAHVDERRRAVGLGPEAEYEALVRRLNKMPERRKESTPAAGEAHP